MFQEERRAWLLDTARTQGRVDVNTCAETLGVTVETIRRDLNDLEDQNHLRRVHGGAIPIAGSNFESDLSRREKEFQKEKRSIALKTIELCEDAETIYLDEGTTPQMIAELWPNKRKVTFLTTAIKTAAILTNYSNVELIFIGGRVRPATYATSDVWGPRMLEDYIIDTAIIGANGITIKNGMSTPIQSVSTIKAAAMASSRTNILIALSNRFGFDSFIPFAKIGDFSVAITDPDIDPTIEEDFLNAGLKIVRGQYS